MKISLEELQKPFRTENCAIHGISLKGLSHEAGNMPLQDSFAAARLDNGWIVLAVADGVGSEVNAEKGAMIAAETAVNHLCRFWGFQMDDKSVERMLHAAYQAACAAIFSQALQDQAPLRSYSTTLHTVIFSDGLLYIMHAGDGGVAILTEEGDFRKVTQPMKGQDGESVVPLQGGPKSWQFSVCRERAQSVAVMTDGIWDKFCPPVLKAYGDEDGVEKSIATFFLSPWARNWREDNLVEIAGREKRVFRGEGVEAAGEFYDTLVAAIAGDGDKETATALVKNRIAPGNLPVRLLRGIKDDITLLTLVRFDPQPVPPPADQFEPTNWTAINRWASGQLYASQNPGVKEIRAEENEQSHANETMGTETGDENEESGREER